MSKKKTNEEIDQRLIDLNKSIIRKSNYTNNKDKTIEWECLICGYGSDPEEPYKTSWSNIKIRGCRNCAGLVPLTNKRIDKKLKEQNRDSIIERGEDFKGNSKTKIKWKCKINFEHEWPARPNDILNSRSGCPECAGNLPLTNEEIDKRLIEQQRSYLLERAEDYKGKNDIDILWRCKINPQHKLWPAIPSSILNNKTGCPECVKLTNEKIDKKLIEQGRDYLLERIEDYKGKNNIKIYWRCKINIKHKWPAAPSNILNGGGCPICKNKNEAIIHKFLTDNNINFIYQYPVKLSINKKNPSEIDFYITQYNLFIEYNGFSHYQYIIGLHGVKTDEDGQNKLKKQQERDKQLREYCKNNNINLLEIDGRIYYNKKLIEFLNNHFKDILK